MSAVTANELSIMGGEVTHSRIGVWTATLDVLATTVPTGKVTLASFDRRWLLVGFAQRAEVFADQLRLFVVGGAGGMAKEIAGKSYLNVPARTIAADILAAAGEKLAASSTISGTLDRWSYLGGRADEALSALALFLGYTWRVDPSGEVWIGKDSYPIAADSEALTMDVDGRDGSIVVSSPAPYYMPGTTVDGKKVETVVHTFGDPFSTRLFVGDKDRIRASFETIVRRAIPIDRYAHYECKVISQNADGSLELKPTNPKIPGLSKVPIRYGVPGITVKVKSAATVGLDWEDGDLSRPRAALWTSDSLESITITATKKIIIDCPDIDAQKGRPLARLGDMVRVMSTPPGTPAMGQIVTANPKHKG